VITVARRQRVASRWRGQVEKSRAIAARSAALTHRPCVEATAARPAR